MSELKPCPFCGSSQLSVQVNDRSPNLFPFADHVLCLHCLASVGSHGFEQTEKEAKAKAIMAWNRRYQEPNEPLTLEQLREMDGEPVWIDGKDYGGWTIFKAGANKQVARCLDNVNLSYYMADYSKTWIAYRRKPESEEV